MKEIYLHVGISKAGSSALQVFFSMNREKLKEKGIYYPSFDEKIVDNDRFIIGVGGNAENIFFLEKETEKFNQQDVSRLEGIKEEISAHERILLSDNGLWGRDIGRIVNNMTSIFNCSVKIIAYIRRQDKWAESLWNQQVKGTYQASMSCWEYCKNNILTEESQANYCNRLRHFSDAVGKDNLYVQIYDDEMFATDKNALFKDFMSIFGIDDISDFHIPKQRVNTSLNRNMVEIKRIINRIPESITLNEEVRRVRGNIASGEKQNIAAMDTSFLEYEQRKELLDFFEECNKEIGREYFGINGSPFSAIKKEDKIRGGGDSRLQDIVGFLGQILVSQSQEIERLHYVVDEFELSKNIPQGSRVLVYGADRKARIIYHWLKRKQEYDVVGIVDRKNQLKVLEPDVQAPEKLFGMEYDFILIGVSESDTADSIRRWLEKSGVESERIIRAEYKQ